jgi:biopolymer transport protein ExbB
MPATMTFSTLLSEGGPVMPLILLTALAGIVLACERVLVWAWWRYQERSLGALTNGAALAAWLAEPGGHSGETPLTGLLRQAAVLRTLAPEQREARLQALLLDGVPRAETRIATIGWLGTILPMLGLLGTVSGMITTFQDLAITTSRQVLSQGLSEALWTTEVGLLGALPLLAVHHLLTRLKTRWVNRLERLLALLFTTDVTDVTDAGDAGDATDATDAGSRDEP